VEKEKFLANKNAADVLPTTFFLSTYLATTTFSILYKSTSANESRTFMSSIAVCTKSRCKAEKNGFWFHKK